MAKKIKTQEDSEAVLAELLKDIDVDLTTSTTAKNKFNESKLKEYKKPKGDLGIVMEIPMPEWAKQVLQKQLALVEFIAEEGPMMIDIEKRDLKKYAKAIKDLWWAKVRYEMPLKMKVQEEKLVRKLDSVTGLHVDRKTWMLQLATNNGQAEDMVKAFAEQFGMEMGDHEDGFFIQGSPKGGPTKKFLEALNKLRRKFDDGEI